MRRLCHTLLTAGLLALAAMSVARADDGECRLALALGLDVSSSVNNVEYALQIRGLADALESPTVVEAILQDTSRYIMSTAFEWSGYLHQVVITDWRRLDSEAAITSFAASLRVHARSRSDQATSLGKGIEFGGRLLANGPDCQRRVLDVSGDGVNNNGIDPYYFYKKDFFEGITVNGLVILGAYPDPLAYYQEHVKHGPRAFIEVAANFEDYRRAIEKKLLREISTQLFLGAADAEVR